MASISDAPPPTQEDHPADDDYEPVVVAAHVGKYEVTIAQRQLPLVGMFFASM